MPGKYTFINKYTHVDKSLYLKNTHIQKEKQFIHIDIKIICMHYLSTSPYDNTWGWTVSKQNYCLVYIRISDIKNTRQTRI